MAEIDDSKSEDQTGHCQREPVDRVFDVRAKVRGAIALLEAMVDYDDDDGTRKADAVWLLRQAAGELTQLAEAVDQVPVVPDASEAR